MEQFQHGKSVIYREGLVRSGKKDKTKWRWERDKEGREGERKGRNEGGRWIEEVTKEGR